MKILSIESSCDETSASVIEKSEHSISALSNTTATSMVIHAATGGIIPENAARMQVKYILPVIVSALIDSRTGITKTSTDISKKVSEEKIRLANQIIVQDIEAIAVTYGPGLIGSLLIGVETAKTLAYTFNKPLIPVNHLLAHIYANYIGRKEKEIKFPFLGLIVSGGHTDLLLFVDHDKYTWLGGTRDDAAGEAFDKVGRLLNLSYPAGPEIEQRARLVSNPTVKFKSPLIGSNDFDFSFSGLKAEVSRFVGEKGQIDTNLKNQICYATQKAIIDVLVKKVLKARDEHNVKMILVGGGVSANETFRKILSSQSDIPVLFPEKEYATDNAAMIGAYALLNIKAKKWSDIIANPELYFA